MSSLFLYSLGPAFVHPFLREQATPDRVNAYRISMATELIEEFRTKIVYTLKRFEVSCLFPQLCQTKRRSIDPLIKSCLCNLLLL